jgi:hypothetical protein
MIRKILHINIESMYDFISMGSSFLKKLKLNPGYFRMTMKLLTRLKINTQLLPVVRYGFQAGPLFYSSPMAAFFIWAACSCPKYLSIQP